MSSVLFQFCDAEMLALRGNLLRKGYYFIESENHRVVGAFSLIPSVLLGPCQSMENWSICDRYSVSWSRC